MLVDSIFELEIDGCKISYAFRDLPHCHVFIHGLMGTKSHFNKGFESQLALGSGFLALDLPGFGDSGRLGQNQSYSFALYAQVLEKLLKSLKIDRAHFVFHSMASALLPEIKRSFYCKVESIALLEGNLVSEDTNRSKEIAGMTLTAFETQLSKIKKNAQRLMQLNLKKSASAADLKLWATGYTQSDGRATWEISTELLELSQNGSIREALRGFTCPKLYFNSCENRPWITPDLMKEIQATIVSVPDSGHFLMLDNPDAIYTTLFDPLSKIQ